MGRDWDNHLAKDARRLIKKCYSIGKVAQQLGISFQSAREILLHEYGCEDVLALRGRLKLKKPLSEKLSRKLLSVKSLYDELKTLEAVANKLGITRERVRQLLNKGEGYGLYLYEVNREKEYEELLATFTREKLVNEIKKSISSTKVCMALNISPSQLQRLLTHFRINQVDYRQAARLGKCLEDYTRIVDALGHHPSTTEMNERPDWRSVWMRIDRQWGSVDKFRAEYGIDKPDYRLHPNTIEAFKQNLDERIRGKQEKKIRLYEFICSRQPVASGEIARELGIGSASVSIYLNELLEESKIRRIGSGSLTSYVLSE
jgi:predicted transcriptional regulator